MRPFEPADARIVVTGGGSGIGAAFCQAFGDAGASQIIVADLSIGDAQAVADRCGGKAVCCDVADPNALGQLINDVEKDGPIDLFVSNAGVTERGDMSVPRDDWQRVWDVNVMAHVEAARLLVPGMLGRGRGHILNVASAAGLLSQFDAPYAVSKHGAVAFAEWLAITYGPRGLGVSCLCPGGVDTPLLRSESAARQSAFGTLMPPEEVARITIDGLKEGRFLILTHSMIAEQMNRRAADPDRWIRGMGRFHASVEDAEK